MSRIGKGLASAAIYISMLTLLSKVFGFLRDTVMAAKFGSGMVVDAYNVSSILPSLLFSGISAAITAAFIPTYTKLLSTVGEEKAENFTGKLAGFLIYLSLILVIITETSSGLLVKLIAPGFTEDKFQLTNQLCQIMLPVIPFYLFAGLLTGYLNAKKKFIIPSLAGYPLNVFTIGIMVLFSNRFGIYSLAWGTLFGVMGQMLIQLPFAIKAGLRISLLPSMPNKYIINFSLLAFPVLISTAVSQFSAIVDRVMASGLPDGAIAALNYAYRLNSFVLMIFVSSIATVYFPVFSQLASEKNIKSFIDTFNKSLNITVLVILPMMVGLAVLRKPIVELLFQRGAFDSKATDDTSIALLMFSIGLLSLAIKEILNRVFYSLQDTKTPMINASLAVGFNIIFNLLFIKYLGHAGLALGTSISSTITVVLLIFSLRKKLGHIGGKKMAISLIKMGLAAIFMGTISVLVQRDLPYYFKGTLSKAIHLFSVIGIGGVSYFIIAYFLGVDELTQISSLIKYKFINRNSLAIKKAA